MKLSVCLAFLALFDAGAYGEERELRDGSNERLDLLRLWWLVDELQIDAEQAATVFPAWSENNRRRRDLRLRRSDIEGQVARSLDREGDQLPADELDRTLAEQISKLREIDAEAAEMKRRFHDQMAEMLTLSQHARLLLFEDRFRRDLRGLIRDVRHFRSSRTGAGPDGYVEPARRGEDQRRRRERSGGPWW